MFDGRFSDVHIIGVITLAVTLILFADQRHSRRPICHRHSTAEWFLMAYGVPPLNIPCVVDLAAGWPVRRLRGFAYC